MITRDGQAGMVAHTRDPSKQGDQGSLRFCQSIKASKQLGRIVT